LDLKIANLANGLRIGRVLIGLNDAHLVMLIFYGLWKEESLREHLMENFLRSIILAFRLMLDSQLLFNNQALIADFYMGIALSTKNIALEGEQ